MLSGDHVATLKDFEFVFDKVISVALALAGIVLFVMIVLSGFRYVTAGDDPQKAEAAKKTLTSTILGIVLVGLAFLILQLIKVFTGADVTNFQITQP